MVGREIGNFLPGGGVSPHCEKNYLVKEVLKEIVIKICILAPGAVLRAPRAPSLRSPMPPLTQGLGASLKFNFPSRS